MNKINEYCMCPECKTIVSTETFEKFKANRCPSCGELPTNFILGDINWILKTRGS